MNERRPMSDDAGGWIKMWPDQARKGRVLCMAAHVAKSIGLPPKFRPYARHLVFSGLGLVWGMANLEGVPAGDEYGPDDILLEGLTLDAIDDIAGIPGLGDAMALETVGWAIATAQGVVLPRFRERNRPMTRSGAADRQREYRKREKAKKEARSVTNRDAGDVTRDVTDPVTPPITNAPQTLDARLQTSDVTNTGNALPRERLNSAHASEQTPEASSAEKKARIRTLIEDVRAVTGETDRDGLYRTIIRTLGETDVQYALSETRVAIKDGAVQKPGALFVERCHGWAKQRGVVLPIGENNPRKRSHAA